MNVRNPRSVDDSSRSEGAKVSRKWNTGAINVDVHERMHVSGREGMTRGQRVLNIILFSGLAGIFAVHLCGL